MGAVIYQEVKQRKWFFLISFILFVALYFAYGRRPENMESLFMIFPIVASAFIFGAEEEIEYIIVGRVSLGAVMTFRFLTIYISVALIPAAFIYLTRDSYVMIKLLLMYTVTILLTCAVGLFWRVVLKSAFSSLLFSSLSYSFVTSLDLFVGEDVKARIFCPFGSRVLEDEYFYMNRLVTLGYALILIGISAYALRRRQNV
jgi:hypothetical protein